MEVPNSGKVTMAIARPLPDQNEHQNVWWIPFVEALS